MSDEMPDDKFKEVMGDLLNHLAAHIEAEQPAIGREFSPDTRMADLPTDLTDEESTRLFGTKYDASTYKLKHLMEMMAPAGTFEAILHHVQHVTDPVFKIEDDDTLTTVMPKGTVIDIVTVGLLAHELLSHIDLGASGAFRVSDMLNGKGPFGD